MEPLCSLRKSSPDNVVPLSSVLGFTVFPGPSLCPKLPLLPHSQVQRLHPYIVVLSRRSEAKGDGAVLALVKWYRERQDDISPLDRKQLEGQTPSHSPSYPCFTVSKQALHTFV